MHLNEIKWQKWSDSCCQMHQIFSSSGVLETSMFGLFFLRIYLTKPWIHLPRFPNALLFWWLTQAPLCLYRNWELCHCVSVENALCFTVRMKAKRFPLSSQKYPELGVQISGRRRENPFRQQTIQAACCLPTRTTGKGVFPHRDLPFWHHPCCPWCQIGLSCFP